MNTHQYCESVVSATRQICELTGVQPGSITEELIADILQEMLEKEIE